MVTVVFCPIIQRFRPVAFASRNDLEREGWDCINGCSFHLNKSVEGLLQDLELSEDDSNVFRSCVRWLRKAKTPQEVDQAAIRLEAAFPACRNWLKWCMQDGISSMAFPGMSRMDPTLRAKLATTTNGTEGTHSRANETGGKRHSIIRGMVAYARFANTFERDERRVAAGDITISNPSCDSRPQKKRNPKPARRFGGPIRQGVIRSDIPPEKGTAKTRGAPSKRQATKHAAPPGIVAVTTTTKGREVSSSTTGGEPTGIANFGNSCFVGVVFQVLFSLGYIRRAVKEVACSASAKPFIRNLEPIFNALDVSVPVLSAEDARGLFWNLVGVLDGPFAKRIAGGKKQQKCLHQQDASEFLGGLFLQRACRANDYVSRQAISGRRGQGLVFGGLSTNSPYYVHTMRVDYCN
eukprot:Opistho-2@5831